MSKSLVIDCYNLEEVSKSHFEFTSDDLNSIIDSVGAHLLSYEDENLYNVLVHLRDELKFCDVCAYFDRT